MQDDLDRALTLLAAAWPDAAPEALARLSIPVRNRELLRLRWISFGPTLEGLTACGACGARLEFSVPIPEVLDRLERLDAGDSMAWAEGGAACTLRAATTDDLRAACCEPDDGEARRCLLARCLSVSGELARTPRRLAVARSDPRTLARFDRLHEGAEIVCEVLCPQCTAVEPVDLDIARFVWDEVRHAALRLLREVHALASAYGWSEGAIAAMTPSAPPRLPRDGVGVTGVVDRMIARARAPLSPVRPLLPSRYEWDQEHAAAETAWPVEDVSERTAPPPDSTAAPAPAGAREAAAVDGPHPRRPPPDRDRDRPRGAERRTPRGRHAAGRTDGAPSALDAADGSRAPARRGIRRSRTGRDARGGEPRPGVPARRCPIQPRRSRTPHGGTRRAPRRRASVPRALPPRHSASRRGMSRSVRHRRRRARRRRRSRTHGTRAAARPR